MNRCDTSDSWLMWRWFCRAADESVPPSCVTQYTSSPSCLLASNLGGGEVKDCDFEPIAILVIGEILGGDMGVETEAFEGLHHELTQPGQCIKTCG